MIKLNSNEGRTIVRNYISALNGDSKDIKMALSYQSQDSYDKAHPNSSK